MDQSQEQPLIDLTLDDDDEDERPDPASPSLPPTEFSLGITDLLSEESDSRAPSQAPLFNDAPAEAEVIDISSDDEDGNEDGSNSPDVQILGQRQLPRRPVLPAPREIDRRLRTPPELRRSNAQSFADSLRPFANLLRFQRDPTRPNLGPFAIAGMGLMDHVGRIMQQGFPPAAIPEPLNLGTYDDIDGLDDYDNIQMDYEAPAFVIEDPGAEDTPADDYKPPTAAKPGFTRDIEEDGDVLVCVNCEDELAVGENETKQQVWVSKRCGHVSHFPPEMHYPRLLTIDRYTVVHVPRGGLPTGKVTTETAEEQNKGNWTNSKNVERKGVVRS